MASSDTPAAASPYTTYPHVDEWLTGFSIDVARIEGRPAYSGGRGPRSS
jgi:hypothetical protein